jgi:indole-3-glycerol phosphate synthase
MAHFLDQIVTSKQKEIDALYRDFGLVHFQQKYSLNHSYAPGAFHKALSKSPLRLIAEIKKASPSKGVIREDFDPKTLAETFTQQHASALSVLTEREYFKGDPAYIALAKSVSSLPVLRKDFIIDPIQVYESKAIGADAILLIKALLPATTLLDLMTLSFRLGMDVLVEIHDLKELEDILPLGCPIVGINNRNLSTFDVDLNTALQLAKRLRDQRPCPLIVAESGYSLNRELDALEANHFSGVLIGEGLAIHPDLLGYFTPKPVKAPPPPFLIKPVQS